METLRVYSVSAINTPNVVYVDPVLTYNQKRVPYEQGFTFNNVQALCGVYDNTINNYTSHYITNKKLLNSFLTFADKENIRHTITTSLLFDSLNPSEEEKYLYIYKDSGLSANNVQRRYTVRPLSSTEFDNSTFVELEFIDDKFVRIKHNNGKYDFFLNTTTTSDLVFYSYQSNPEDVTTEGSDMFRYIIDDDGYMQLLKNIDNSMYIVTLRRVGLESRLTLEPLLSGRMFKGSNNIIKINYTFNKPALKSNSSWISYDKNKINILTIDRLRSSYDRPGQYLLHTSYNDAINTINLNYLTLNTDRSEKGYIKRGSNMYSGSPYVPDADFREYVTLHTGHDQEKGNDNIGLTYIFYDKDILVRSGFDTYFTVPSSIFPFERLNINDTKFILNGSLGGPSPRVADKIFVNRKYTSSYNNGRYLCTWLSAATPQSLGLWVDRYYYPDAISKQEALSGDPYYTPSFVDTVDSSNVTQNRKEIASGVFFDKRSDMALVPDMQLQYERLGESDYEQIVIASSPLISGFNTAYNIKNDIIPYQSSEIFYNGDLYNRYPVSQINPTGQFTLSFEAYIDPGKTYGYQLLGNKTTHGFGVRNDILITPFIYIRQGKELYIYNTDSVFLSRVAFDQEIRDVIIGRPLEDFFVSCEGGYLYRINALGNKLKLEILPDIATYINYLHEEDVITFLLPDESIYSTTANRGRCVYVDKTTLQPTTGINAEPLPNYNGLEYDRDYSYSIVRYNNVLYRVPGDRVKVDGVNADLIYYIENRKELVRYNFKDRSFDTFAETPIDGPQISDYNIDNDRNVIVAYGNKISVFTYKREFLYSVSLSGTELENDTILDVDISRGYFKDTPPINYTRLLTFDPITKRQTMVTVVPGIETTILNTVQLSLTARDPRTTGVYERYTQTNYNNLLTYSKQNTLRFDLTLINYLSSENIIDRGINFDLTNLDVGYHTFTYRFDSLQGNITLFVDGVLTNNLTISPGKYKIQNLFADDFFAGTTGFLNGIDLATYLQQPGAFYIRDLSIKNLFIYNRALQDDEIVALNLYKKPIEDTVLSVPCGQRNNVEEIERIFKYGRSNSSNSVNVYLNNLNINNQTFKNNIRNVILQEAKNILPIGVSINDIKFINYR